MKSISIDIETFSSVDLSRCGVYKYAESSDFQILLFGYSVDGSEVNVIDLASGQQIPHEILSALTDDDVIKWAFNANFEGSACPAIWRTWVCPLTRFTISIRCPKAVLVS